MDGSHLVRASALAPQPWVNGQGVTRTIAAEAEGGWTIGIADLAGDADFSHFPGSDRIFTLIEGAGCTLRLAGRGVLSCRLLLPAMFPGDVPVHCALHGVPGRAFNLVLDRARFAGEVMPRAIAPGHRIVTPPGTAALHCLRGALLAGGTPLEAGDTLLEAGGIEVAAAAEAIAILVVLGPR